MNLIIRTVTVFTPPPCKCPSEYRTVTWRHTKNESADFLPVGLGSHSVLQNINRTRCVFVVFLALRPYAHTHTVSLSRNQQNKISELSVRRLASRAPSNRLTTSGFTRKINTKIFYQVFILFRVFFSLFFLLGFVCWSIQISIEIYCRNIDKRVRWLRPNSNLS